MFRWLRGCATAAVVVALLGACSDGETERPRSVEALEGDFLPATVLGLDVGEEPIDKLLEDIDRPYVEAVGLFSFRREELLQATLQVNRLADDDQWATEDFRRSVAAQIAASGSELPEFRVGGHTVFVAGDAQQTTAVWFRDGNMMVLVTRSDFTQPRSLLRELIGIEVTPA